jgi:hypothetical protein
MEQAAALRVIRDAKAHAEKVRSLLRALGDNDENLALSARFRQTARRMERIALSEESAEAFGELTLTVHQLNHALSQCFYP